ncbi:Tuberous sclerosis 2-like protein [Rhizina undulata]
MPLTPSSVDPPPQPDPSRQSSSLASVFRNFPRLNRAGFSIPPSPAAPISSNGNRLSGQFDYFEEGVAHTGQLLLEKLRPNNPLNDRIAAAETLRSIVSDYTISTVTEIWSNAQDLLHEDNPQEARQVAFNLLTACISQHDPTSLDRLRFYRNITQHACNDDFIHQLSAITALTNGGRDLSTFERDIGGQLSKWLRVWFKEATNARQMRKREGGSPDSLSGAEFCLKALFRFTTDIIKFNFGTFEEREINQLLGDVLSICRKTTGKPDIECSITFIETLITYGYVPRNTLKPCIEVLCGAYATIRDLADATWNAISNLCKSYMAQSSILVLREILETPAKKHTSNTNMLRGAVWFLEKLTLAADTQGMPPMHFSFVMSAYQTALCADSLRLEFEICRAIQSILANRDIISQVSYDEWTVPLDILVHCSRRTFERADGTPLTGRNMGNEFTSSTRPPDKEGLGLAIAQSLFSIINLLEGACKNPEFGQVEEVVDFFVRVHGHLPDSTAELIINYYAAEHLCYPSCSDWKSNCRKLIEIFFRDRLRPSSLRISVLSVIKDVYETIRGVCEESFLHELVMVVFEDIQSERNTKVLEALVKIVVDVAGDGGMKLFDKLMAYLISFVNRDRSNSISDGDQSNNGTPAGYTSAFVNRNYYGNSQVNIIVRGLVRLFIKNANTSAEKAVKVYEQLVKIAGSSTCETDARLSAMKLLFRLRADSEHRILILEKTEVENLAAVLDRVAKSTDDAASVTTEDSSSISSRSRRSDSVSQSSFLFRSQAPRTTAERYERSKPKTPLWSYPEARPLPEKPTHESSPVLVTFYDPPSDFPQKEGPSLDPKTALRMSLWIEQVIPIIQQGCDWEIYSYVLVHLSSQLANKTAFRNCKAHIGMLRSYICDQLHTNRIPNTDLPGEVKKADIAVILINLLTTLISYHEKFAKNETEGMVKAFQLGLHSWQRTAKPCIHALLICCYELPASTGKFLPGILTKLSQIITSSAVSVHILEFLSALAKLPSLYSNFTEPDFRNIFGIAFRYIQHTKETAQQPSRVSYSGRLGGKDPPSGDHPEQPEHLQYVLTLAYNVLTTWFLSLRLAERPKYVSWIIRGLVLHDGSNTVDEQSQACIDMLQRFTYSEHDLKPPTKLTPHAPGILTKNWLHGLSILSVQMMTNSGIARICVRRPSGSSYYCLKPEARDVRTNLRSSWLDITDELPSNFDGANSLEKNSDRVLPSHLLLQLTAAMGTTEHSRLILLPEDDKTIRALDVFDRIPVVDFHKVGVVYVGTGQTEEKDILANEVGPPDYVDFVDGLGELIRLKGTDINTGGLDRENDLDGEFTYFWSDRITEIVFHVTTMMPTMEHDPLCTMKKRHIGNDFVNIIFNNSGLPWKFDTIPSQFNFILIIISPEARAGFVSSRSQKRGPEDRLFYRVQLVCRDDFTQISPAQEVKMVSHKSLPAFVRNMALNASVYAHVYNSAGTEYISNWRHRLRSINQLRERVTSPASGAGSGSTTTSPVQSAPASRRVSMMSGQSVISDHQMRNASTSPLHANGDSERDSETEDILMSLDFSRFT